MVCYINGQICLFLPCFFAFVDDGSVLGGGGGGGIEPSLLGVARILDDTGGGGGGIEPFLPRMARAFDDLGKAGGGGGGGTAPLGAVKACFLHDTQVSLSRVIIGGGNFTLSFLL